MREPNALPWAFRQDSLPSDVSADLAYGLSAGPRAYNECPPPAFIGMKRQGEWR
jgi:hypothetical protein